MFKIINISFKVRKNIINNMNKPIKLIKNKNFKI